MLDKLRASGACRESFQRLNDDEKRTGFNEIYLSEGDMKQADLFILFRAEGY